MSTQDEPDDDEFQDDCIAVQDPVGAAMEVLRICADTLRPVIYRTESGNVLKVVQPKLKGGLDSAGFSAGEFLRHYFQDKVAKIQESSIDRP